MADPIEPKESVNKMKRAWELIQKDPLNYIVMIFLGTLAASFTGGILGGAVYAGIIKAGRKLESGEKVQMTDAFSQMSKLVPTLIYSLLVGLGYLAVGLVVFLLSLLGGALFSTGNPLGIIVGLILFLVMGVIGIVSGLFLSLVYMVGLFMIVEGEQSPVDALKKALGWINSRKGTAIEFALAQFLCGLCSLVPVVGVYFAVGMSMLVGTFYYDEEIAAS